jgi:hypothetical protein
MSYKKKNPSCSKSFQEHICLLRGCRLLWMKTSWTVGERWSLYSQHIYATSAIKFQQELLCPHSWSIRCFCTISGALLNTSKGKGYRQKINLQ